MTFKTLKTSAFFKNYILNYRFSRTLKKKSISIIYQDINKYVIAYICKEHLNENFYGFYATLVEYLKTYRTK